MNKPEYAKVIGIDQYGEFMVIDVNGVDVTLRKITAGEVTRDSDGVTITLSEDMWVMDTLCTIELWEAVMGSRPSNLVNEEDISKPVTYVSWHDANDFSEKLNKLVHGLTSRLPSEDEWEYACRAGSTTLYNNGTDSISRDEAAFYTSDNPLSGPVPVKSYKPNAWGLYDMHGNAWEWTRDEYKPK